MNARWISILLIYALGLAGTSALGMLGPLASDIGASFQVSASSVGVAIAGQLLPLAFAGLIMGWLIDRLGPKPLLLIGLIALGGASLANAWVGDFNVLRGTLLVQGVALVALLTSGQGLLMMCTTGRKQVQSLTLWSTVMPVGYALGLLMVSPFAGSATWQHVFFVHAALAGGLLLAFPWIPGVRAIAATNSLMQVLRNTRVIRFGLSLSLSALAGIGSSAVGAIYLHQVHGMEVGVAAQWMAIASLCGVAGSVVIGGLLTKGLGAGSLASTILVTAITGGLAFYWPSGVLALAIAGAMFLQLCVGGFIALVFSLLPRVLEEPGQSGSAAGLVGQITGVGAALSAPLFFRALEVGQWYYFIAILVCAWGTSYLLLPVWRRQWAETVKS